MLRGRGGERSTENKKRVTNPPAVLVISNNFSTTAQENGETAAEFWRRLAQMGYQVGAREDEILRNFRGGLQATLQQALVIVPTTLDAKGLLAHLAGVEARMRATYPPLPGCCSVAST